MKFKFYKLNISYGANLNTCINCVFKNWIKVYICKIAVFSYVYKAVLIFLIWFHKYFWINYRLLLFTFAQIKMLGLEKTYLQQTLDQVKINHSEELKIMTSLHEWVLIKLLQLNHSFISSFINRLQYRIYITSSIYLMQFLNLI
jgi:hypothetical protein